MDTPLIVPVPVPLSVLLLEDNATDADLIVRELRRAGFELKWSRVDTEADFIAALQRAPDLILADYALPQFDGLRALQGVRSRGLDTPFILISGTVGEETAVHAIQQGANDYLLKDRIARLGPVVRRVLDDKRLRDERRRLDQVLRESELRYRRLFEASMDGVLIVDAASGLVQDASPFLAHLLGCSRGELLQQPLWQLPCFSNLAATPDDFARLQRHDSLRLDDLSLHTWQGVPVQVEFASTAYETDSGRVVQCHIHDISARRQEQLALQASLREKEALLKEVHHRVKNNLQIINSLLRLEAGRHAAPATQRVLRDMQGRILSMAMLHETVYRETSFAAIELAAYLKKLAEQVFRSLAAEPGQVSLRLDLSPVSVGLERAIPCGLLVYELLANCLKHAFPDSRRGEVRLVLRALDGGALVQLQVSDTGTGLPEDFQARRGQSLGLQLVDDLVLQLGGRLDIGPAPAAVFSLHFPADGMALPLASNRDVPT